MESGGGKVRILVFASGDEKGGGSGFQELVEFRERIRRSLMRRSWELFLTMHRGSLQKSGRPSYPFRALGRTL